MKRVAVLGAGMVCKPMIDYFLDHCRYGVVMATRTKDKALRIIDGRPHGHAVHWEFGDNLILNRLVNDVDIVVSMIPPTLHIPVAEACLRHGRNLVTTSYISPQMMELHPQALERDVLLLNECGEDPGLDHMSSKRMIDHAHKEGGRVESLISFGAGLPSFEANRNPFGYKFSWSPKGVLLAANSAAAYLRRGERVVVASEDLMARHWFVDIADVGTFETYPNRDSTRYKDAFKLDDEATLFRGILRFPGWCNTLHALKGLGLLDDSKKHDLTHATYTGLLASQAGLEERDDMRRVVCEALGLEERNDIIKRMKWLGLFDKRTIPLSEGSAADVLTHLMLRKLSYEKGERDMVIIHDEIVVEKDGHREKRTSTMITEGTPFGDTAMSRAVALPAAIATRLILEGKVAARGVQLPTLRELYKPILEELPLWDIDFEHRTSTLDPKELRE